MYKCRNPIYVLATLGCMELLWFIVNNKHFEIYSGVNNVLSSNISSFSKNLRTLPDPMGDKRLWPVNDIMSTENVSEYFKNTLLIVMMSPSRYHLVHEVRKHYTRFFRHIFFCGPNTSTKYGIRGYFIASGLQQYRAVNRILREDYMREDEGSRSGRVRGQLKRGLGTVKDDKFSNYNITNIHYGDDSETVGPTHSTLKKDSIDGMLYVSDDTILQPWSLAAKGFDKRIPWANQMGIGNSLIYTILRTVPGMSVESSHPLGQKGQAWHLPKSYFRNVRRALSKAGDDFRNRLALSARATPVDIYIWSDYQPGNKEPHNVTKEKYEDEGSRNLWSKFKNMSSRIINEKDLKWSIFYTIVDSYYVPRSMWGEYCEAADLMSKYLVFGEVGIPTILRSIFPTYEEMEVQYYWKGNDTAAKCSRKMWNINTVDGIHRCRHDHEFVHAIFSNDLFRKKILNDKEVRDQVTNLSELVPVKYE